MAETAQRGVRASRIEIRTRLHRKAAALSVSVLLLLASAEAARAGCNLIPGTEKAFNSTLGATNRPFAAPGESLEVRVRPCDTASLGLTANATDHVVTVIFTPPSGPRHAVVLTADADCTAINPLLGACEAQLTGGGTATCVAGTTASLQIVDRNGERRLSFTFPDTDALLDAPSDDHTLSGPATIAVSQAGDPLPCALATSACTSATGLRACIGDFFANDGACGATIPHASFAHFAALPPPNNYQADCFKETPPCDIDATGELRFAVDGEGNLLLPVSWQGVLVPSGVPMPRLLRVRVRSPLPFQVPDQVFVGSFTPEGGKLPPIFEPQIAPGGIEPNIVTLFGSTDAPYTILRFAKHHGTCNGGANAGQRCSNDAECLYPEGTCDDSCAGAPSTFCSSDAECDGNGPCGELFDFSAATAAGPLVLPRPFITTPFVIPGLCQQRPADGRHRYGRRRVAGVRRRQRDARQHGPGGDPLHARSVRSAPAVPRDGQQGDVPYLRTGPGGAGSGRQRRDDRRAPGVQLLFPAAGQRARCGAGGLDV